MQNLQRKFMRVAYRMRARIILLCSNEEGLGTVEIILIVVVLISLVAIFKTQMTSVVNTIFKKIASESGKI